MDKKDKVLFLIEIDEDKTGIEVVFAFFPEVKLTNKMCNSYAHIGQHSPCHIEYADICKEANSSQYAELAKELTRIGYDLEILNNSKS